MSSKKTRKKKAGSKAIEKPRTGGEIVKHDYGDDVGGGFEGQSQSDIQVPFLGILQDLSPQTKKVKAEFIEGATPGMLFNSVTEELFDGEEGVLFVPGTTEHCFIEWVPRDDGGGFVARHELDSPVVAAARASGAKINELRTEAGNELLETYYIIGVIIPEDGGLPIPALVAMTSSKIKVYRKWNTRIRSQMVDVGGGRKQNPPMFANAVRITTFQDQNAAGQVFFNFVLAPANGTLAESLLAPDDPRYQAARKIRDMSVAGTATAAYDSQTAEGVSGDETVPF